MNRLFKLTMSICLVIVMTLTFAACGQKEDTSIASDKSSEKTTAKVEEQKLVEIPFMHYQAGKWAGADYRKLTIDRFNEKFDGKYKIVFEDVPTPEAYIEKLKLLNATNDLPAFIEAGRDPSLLDILVKEDKLLDLSEYINSDEEWLKMLRPKSIAANTTADGKIFAVPNHYAGYCGIFYNEEMFKKAGITEFPKTWDDFFAACDTLKKNDITPIAIEPTFLATLAGTANIMTYSEEAVAWLNEKYPTDFNKPFFIDGMNVVKRLFDNSTKDAVGGNYAMGTTSFLTEKTAMIPNGPWMIGQFYDTNNVKEDFAAKISFAPFPGNVVMSNEEFGSGWGVITTYPKEVQEGCIEYMKMEQTDPVIIDEFILAMQALVPAYEMPDSLKQKLNKQFNQIAELTVDSNIGPFYQGRWDTLVQNEGIAQNIQSLALGQITAEEYAQKLTESAKKNAEQTK